MRAIEEARAGSTRGRGGRVPMFLAALSLLALSRPVAAATVDVDCSGQTPGAFTSVNAALSSLTAAQAVGDWDYVLLKGNCTENVMITGGRRVWIAPEGSQCPFSGCPQGGPALRIMAASPGAPVDSPSS